MIAAERRDLADLGEKLTEEQFDAQSLCEAWKVRHVFAHVADVSTEKLGEFVVGFVKAGFNVDRALERSAVHSGDTKDQPTLVKELRENAESRKKPPGVSDKSLLADIVIHTQDIRRAIDVPREVPHDRLLSVLETTAHPGALTSIVLPTKKRLADLRLIANDIEWTHGVGAEVRGTGEALLMAMSGRPAALDDLQGDGVATLRSRL